MIHIKGPITIGKGKNLGEQLAKAMGGKEKMIKSIFKCNNVKFGAAKKKKIEEVKKQFAKMDEEDKKQKDEKKTIKKKVKKKTKTNIKKKSKKKRSKEE